jgi:hypothetical protein
MNITSSRLFAITLVTGLGFGVSSVALAHVNVGVGIGVPAPTYAPAQPYVEPQPEYAQPPGVVVVTPGWYGDRYYDGHRYWARREWEERHHEWARGDWHDDH